MTLASWEKKFRVRIIIFLLGMKKRPAGPFKRLLASFQASRVIVNHFVAGFQAGRVQRVKVPLAAVHLFICLSVAKMCTPNAIFFKKLSHLEVWSIDDL